MTLSLFLSQAAPVGGGIPLISTLIMLLLGGAAIFYFIRDQRNKKLGIAGRVPGGKDGAEPAKLPELESPAKSFQENVLKVLDAQSKLLKRHEMLPFHDLDYKEPMHGHTLEVYKQTERDIHDVRTRWIQLQDISEQVDTLAPADKPLTPERYKEVARLIDEANTSGVEDMLAHCVGELDRLEEAHELIAPTQEEIGGHLAAIRESIDVLAAAGVEDIPFGDEWDGLNQLAETHLSASVGDPLGRAAPLNTARDRLHDVREHLGRLHISVGTVKECREALGTLRSATEKHRADGIPMVEPEGNPDPMFEEADREFVVYDPALKRGDVDAACNSADLASRAIEEAERRIQSTIESRDLYELEFEKSKNEIHRLKNAKGDVDKAIATLEKKYARESWVEILSPIERGEGTLDKVGIRLERAQAAFGEKRYIAAANEVETVMKDLEQVGHFFGGAKRCVDKLEQIANACKKRRSETSALATELIEFLKTHKNTVPEHYTRELSDACKLLDKIEQQEMEERPNWPLIQRELEEVAVELSDVKAEANAITTGLAEFKETVAALQNESVETSAFLAQHTADRPRANQIFAGAKRQLDEFQRNLERPTKGVETLRRELEHIEMELKEAKESAGRDIRAEEHASNTLSQAAKVLTEVRAYNNLGVTAKTTAAETQLARARDLLIKQDYEAIPEVAIEVEKLANAAFEEAQAATRKREEELRSQRSEKMKQIVSVGAAVGAQILGEVVRSQMYGHRRPNYHRRHRGFF